jgi:hypothetical protein
MNSIPFVTGSVLSLPSEGPIIVGHEGISQQFWQIMSASLVVDGKDVLFDMLVFWRQIRTEDDIEIELQEIIPFLVEVDGLILSAEELPAFISAYADEYMETLEWIALSSIDSVETLPC